MLGPQRPETSVKQAMETLSFSGPIVSITAGWRDSEGEIEELQADIGHPIEDLMIYHRAEEIFAREHELRALQRERQDQAIAAIEGDSFVRDVVEMFDATIDESTIKPI